MSDEDTASGRVDNRERWHAIFTYLAAEKRYPCQSDHLTSISYCSLVLGLVPRSRRVLRRNAISSGGTVWLREAPQTSAFNSQ